MRSNKLILSVSQFLMILGACGQLNEPAGNHSIFPAVSPDGQSIAYFCYPTNGDKTIRGVYIMSIDGRNKKLIYPQEDGSVNSWITWSPSGRQLLIQEGIITLYNNEFKEIRPNKIIDLIKNRQNYSSNFMWAPDGASILYSIEDSIYICDTLFENSRKLPFIGKGVCWMPDGERLSYMRGGELFIIDTLAYQEIQITNDGKWKSAPISSPDGTIFSYVVAGNNIWLINTDGTDQRFLTKISREGYSWSPDSKFIVFSKTFDDWSTVLWKIDIDGNNAVQISK